MADKLMLYIPNDDTQNYTFCIVGKRLDTNKNLLIIPNVVKPTKKENVNIRLWGLV